MTQKVKYLKVEDLVLWTENPRDPISSTSSDQKVADRAWEDRSGKWSLRKLAKEMSTHYDFSELPTIVYHGKKPVVYDGNRRMILAKLKHGFVSLEGFDLVKIPEIPLEIPCNVCSKQIGIQNIYRKHAESGSWGPLERDIFLEKYMNSPASTFLKLERETKLIAKNPFLNQRFVKDEIFSDDKLKEMGLGFNQDTLESKHSNDEALEILNDIVGKIGAQVITTRKNRGKVLEILEKNSRGIIEKNKAKPLTPLTLKPSAIVPTPKKKKSRRTKKLAQEIFGGTLILKHGQVSDLYLDITDLYNHYNQKKESFSQYFPSLIRMSLRLLAEAAAEDQGVGLDNYLKNNFARAKKELNSDDKTTLSTQNVKRDTVVQLLHIGAHNYQAGNNIDQTIAISIILGQILTVTHGR